MSRLLLSNILNHHRLPVVQCKQQHWCHQMKKANKIIFLFYNSVLSCILVVFIFKELCKKGYLFVGNWISTPQQPVAQ